MDKKYFLRGLGLGLIIGAIVMMVALKSSNTTDEANDSTTVKNSASEETSWEDTATEGQTLENTETDEASQDGTVEVTTEGGTTEAVTDTDTEEITTAEETTEDTTESVTTEELTSEAGTTEEQTSESTSEEAKSEDEKGGSITVSYGMSAMGVAKKLHEIGVIDDEEDFYMYMYNNGYASKILQGTFTFTGDESYEEIANILMYTR